MDFYRQRKQLAMLRKCGKSLPWLNRRKFELKTEIYSSKRGKVVVYLKFT